MEKRGLVIAMVVMLAMLFFWGPLTTWFARQVGWEIAPPRQIADAPTSQPTTDAAPTTVTSAPPGATSAPGPAMGPAEPAAGLSVAPATQPAVFAELGSAKEKDERYKMAVRISPQGAGIDSIVLNEFKREVKSEDRFVFQQPYDRDNTHTRSLATRSITINGTAIDLSTVEWSTETVTADSAAFSVVLTNSAGPLARITKTYTLLPISDPGKGYEVVATQAIANLTDAPLKVQTSINGPTMPPREQDRGGDRQVIAGYVSKGFIQVTHELIESFSKDKPSQDFAKDKDGNPFMWAGAASIYFQALIRPVPLTDPNAQPSHIEHVKAEVLNPDGPAIDHEIAMTFVSGEMTVAPRGSLSVPFRAFFGPRQRSLLNTEYYAAFPLSYDDTLVLTQGPCGWCTFQWLINILVSLLGMFHFITRDWGLAIILLVVLVRAILHPVTKRSQIAMAKMGKMAPEMERLKKKYGDNKEELSKAMWELQKEQGVGAYLGCLPMFLQMPIWIALWQSLQTTFELRQAPFLEFFGINFTWIRDLSKPDHLIEIAQPFTLFGFIHISGLNVLPFLLAFIFWLQMKFQPKPPTMSKEQEQQQKMMQWMMPVLFPVMLYSGPSGLNLYILTSTFLGIIESKIVRDHIKEREEAEKAGRVIVDAGRKFKGGGGGGGSQVKRPVPSDKPKGGLMGWLADLQARAEQVRREADKRK